MDRLNTMDNKMEQRANIKFCWKLGKTLSETRIMLKKAYDKDCLADSTVKDWYIRFVQGKEDIADGHQIKLINTTKKVLEILQSDPCAPVSVIAKLTGTRKTTVHRIVNNLGIRKICESDTLTDDQEDPRIEHCRDMIRAADSDSNFMKNIVTCGRIWISEYEPLPEQQTASTSECQSKKKTKPKRMSLQKSMTLLTVFFDSRGMIYKEFIPEDQAVNAVYYLGILERLWDSISRDRPQYKESGSWCLLHDNTLIHKSRTVRDFLVKKGITGLEYPSPDFSPCDIWLFPILQPTIEKMGYNNIKDMENALTETLEKISKEKYNRCFDILFNRYLQSGLE